MLRVQRVKRKRRKTEKDRRRPFGNGSGFFSGVSCLPEWKTDKRERGKRSAAEKRREEIKEERVSEEIGAQQRHKIVRNGEREKIHRKVAGKGGNERIDSLPATIADDGVL